MKRSELKEGVVVISLLLILILLILSPLREPSMWNAYLPLFILGSILQITHEMQMIPI